MTSSNYFTTREAADLLGLSIPTVQQWVERGLLKSWKTEGGHRRILQSSVMETLETRNSKAATEPHMLPVLIVEDDVNLIRLYKVQMRNWPFGTTVFVAPNGYEGLILVGEVQPKLLICDLGLPGVNGFNIVRALCANERFKELAIVVVSGLPAPEIMAHGGLPERVVVMSKPINFQALRDIAHERWLRMPELAYPRQK